MKHNEQAAANSLAILGAGFYLVCVLLTFFVPGLYLAVAKSWMHGADISQIWRKQSPEIGSVILGLITFTAASWIAGYAFAWLYNYFLKSK